MSNLKRIAGFLFSWRTLACVAVLLLAVAIWFVGPLLAFGDLHPFAGVFVRAAVIVALVMLVAFWLLGWPTSAVWVAALCVLFWFAGPLFALGEHRPFEPIWVRVLVTVAAVLCYAGYGAYKLWQALRTNDALLKRVLNAGQEKNDVTARADLRALGVVVSKGVNQLRRLRGGASLWRRMFESGRYLYELPWYMMVGAPGSGKTTAILNSGLQFPLAEQMNAQSSRASGTSGGTVNCDWWFANDAVLIDTAGRYAQHDVPGDDAASAANAAEWKGFLGLLRKHRPRAPINGAVLSVSVADLANQTGAERTAHAAALRARLGELRQELGIRYPVYVMVTKLDLLPGFPEYFQSLTAEGRTQIWGFTLPYDEGRRQTAAVDLRMHCGEELRLLELRIDNGLNHRLLEEYENDRRKKLYALPQEFRSVSAALTEWLCLVFLDSRYDDSQLQSMLRGVYFTSSEQTGEIVAADRETVLQRLKRRYFTARGDDAASAQARHGGAIAGNRSYFLRDVFQQVIVREAHLVRPNLSWEMRFRLTRWARHLLAGILVVWLGAALTTSFDHNRAYLDGILRKSDVLAERVAVYDRAPRPAAIAGVLDGAHDLPLYRNLDLDAPGIGYRYGLYVAPRIVDASDTTYRNLLRKMLLPQIERRVANVLNAQVGAKQADDAYRTLKIYLMLFDAGHYDAKAVKEWVMRDWERSDGAAEMGGRGVLERHLDALFADGRAFEPAGSPDAALIQRARLFLNQNPAPERLYERAVSTMAKDAPDNFTLARAVGQQGAGIFKLADGSRFASGIPGLYTYEGYHQVFRKHLAEFLAQARDDDDWAMGRASTTAKLADLAQGVNPFGGRSPLADEILRRYLTDYYTYWQQFLADIQPATADGRGADVTLAVDLDSLRTLAAPDSPLVRLARTVVRQTSLSIADANDDAAQGDAALAVIGRESGAARSVAAQARKLAAKRPEQRLEKELVDNRFAALREVVTGQADTGSGPAMADPPVQSGTRPLQLDGLVALINEQYTRLVVTQNALAAGSMPPAQDIGTALQLEADKLPAPLQTVLSSLATQMAGGISREAGTLLATQMDTSVGKVCRGMVEGKYPFAPGTQEVDIEDFNQLFAAGGLFDTFFQKSLADYVDTSAKPWRYKALTPGMPPINGPSLEPFERAATIRDVFFRDPGAKRMAWKLDAKVASLDPEITELSIDLDGQTQRYVHGPVMPFGVTWPGPRGGAIAEITAKPRIRPDTSTIVATGPWALFRLIERARVTRTASANQLTLDFNFDHRHAALELRTSGQMNPMTSNLLKDFHCPGALR
ncbi:type VI secretion system membrane subunit TssM [Burkholderia ubonensis]|uniref:type VI secretion system membrane subunit TssM n=1 Tax=Burkholderia ubonensis TaxID=101571 RepID=UPI000752C5E7|nr:type VI secretion system membrane subunit TssM [Burkholderia ubonensis]KVN74679.1 type VI secretion protein VasK [Burkholderia ubonensis]